MQLSIISWNGTNINNSSPFVAILPRGQMANIRLNPVITPRADDYPDLSSAVKQGSTIIVNVIIPAGQNINTNRELIKRYFAFDGTKANLIAADTADGNKQYYRR